MKGCLKASLAEIRSFGFCVFDFTIAQLNDHFIEVNYGKYGSREETLIDLQCIKMIEMKTESYQER